MKLLILVALVVAPLPARSQSPFEGDERLLRKVTIRAVGLTMRDLLADLTVRTGIKFAADPYVAEDKAALFAHDRPLHQTLESLANFFRFTWVRQDGPPPYSYRLTQSLKQRKAQEEELDFRLYRAADAILHECHAVSKAATLSDNSLTARAEALRAEAAAERDPVKRSLLYEDLRSVQSALQIPQNVASSKFIGSFNRDQVVEIMMAGASQFASPAQSGWRPLSNAFRDAIWKAFADNNRRFDRQPDFEPTFARIRLECQHGTDISLTGLIESGRMNDTGGWRANGLGFRFPTMPLPDGDDEGLDEPLGWMDIPSFVRPVTMKSKPFLRPPDEEKPLEPPFHSRYFDELDQSLPIDLISDAFYSGNWYWMDFANKPVGAVLTGMATNSFHTWSIHNGFVHFRSRQYVSCRFSEPPYTRLKQWSEMPSDRLGSVDGMAEIASLSQPQAQVALDVLTSIGKFNWRMPERNPWAWLRLWSALTPGQRGLAKSERGLPMRSLRPAQSRLALLAAEAAQHQRVATQGSMSPVDQDALAASFIRFRIDDSISYGIHEPGRGTSISGGSGGRDQAVKSLLGHRAGMTEDLVQEVHAQRIKAEFLSNGEAILSSGFDLPQRWSPRKKSK